MFVQEAKRALSASERVLERTRAAARGELGKVRLAYTFAIAYETLPALLGALAEDAPEVLQHLHRPDQPGHEPAVTNLRPARSCRGAT